jgi:hypothetical protein
MMMMVMMKVARLMGILIVALLMMRTKMLRRLTTERMMTQTKPERFCRNAHDKMTSNALATARQTGR